MKRLIVCVVLLIALLATSAAFAGSFTHSPDIDDKPSPSISVRPTAAPTLIPTVRPTAVPTNVPSDEPTLIPTVEPTVVPTATPTAKPTAKPTKKPASKPAAQSPTVPTPALTEPQPTSEATPTYSFYLRNVEASRQSDSFKALFRDILEFVQNNNAIDFFGEEAQFAALEFLPSGTDLAGLKLDEFEQIESDNYSVSMGDVDATFEFPTQYKQGDVLLALAGVKDGDKVTWTPLKTEVTTDGRVTITFTQECVLSLQGRVCALALLRAK